MTTTTAPAAQTGGKFTQKDDPATDVAPSGAPQQVSTVGAFARWTPLALIAAIISVAILVVSAFNGFKGDISRNTEAIRELTGAVAELKASVEYIKGDIAEIKITTDEVLLRLSAPQQ